MASVPLQVTAYSPSSEKRRKYSAAASQANSKLNERGLITITLHGHEAMLIPSGEKARQEARDAEGIVVPTTACVSSRMI
jgi:hypothetical protein